MTARPAARSPEQARRATAGAAGRRAVAARPIAGATHTTRSGRERPRLSPKGFLPRSVSMAAPGLDLKDIRPRRASMRRGPPEDPESARTRTKAAAAAE